MPGCALGPCDRSKAKGGPGCYLCDVIAQLPQPRTALDVQKRDRAELKESKPLPDLTAPRAAATALGRIRRRRVGPHR
jgi:hypothetical protein